MAQLQIPISDELHAALKLKALSTGKTLKELVNEALARVANRKQKDEDAA